MQPIGRFEIEPQLFLPNSIMCLGRECLCIPTAEAFIIQFGGVARDHNAAGQPEQGRKKPDMIVLTIVVSVDTSASTSAREIWRITVNQFVTGETLGSKEVDRICFDVGGKRWEKPLPASNDRGVSVDSDAPACRLLVPKNGTSSQMGLNVCGMGRKDINDVLIALPLPTWIPHGTIIVISGDDVKSMTLLYEAPSPRLAHPSFVWGRRRADCTVRNDSHLSGKRMRLSGSVLRWAVAGLARTPDL
jgi:hypothetical protein